MARIQNIFFDCQVWPPLAPSSLSLCVISRRFVSGLIIAVIIISVDVNECDINNGNCQQMCKNLYGRHSCSCREGFVLDSNKRTCSGKRFKHSDKEMSFRLHYSGLYNDVYIAPVLLRTQPLICVGCSVYCWVSCAINCVRGTRTQPLICVGCSVHCWVSCAINKGSFFEIAFSSSSSTHFCLALRRLVTFCLTLTN